MQALRHPYVAQFHNSDDEPSCPQTIKLLIDDNKKYSTNEYRYGMSMTLIDGLSPPSSS